MKRRDLPLLLKTALLTTLALSPALSACVGPTPQKATGPLSVRGSVRGLEYPQHARIAIYRVSPFGVVERLHGADVTADADGRFETEPLNPDQYLFAMRAPGHPVSIVRVPVPPAPPTTLVARPPLGLAKLELTRGAETRGPLSLLLSRVDAGVPVVDRRPVSIAAATSLVEGLTPGRWTLDVLGTGATTEIDVPAGARRLVLTLDAPITPNGVEMKGRVLRSDGEPALGLAVTVRPLTVRPLTVRPLSEGGSMAGAWGRYALTNSDGGYHLVGIPPGPALLRVESRDAVFRRLPRAEVVTIPPSGRVDHSFVVDP